MAEDGLVTIASNHPAKETLDRFAAALAEKSITIFARIDHAEGATSVGMDLRPTELLIFGNPKAGTPLMQGKQTIGADLPLKALAWTDEDGKTWLSVTDVVALARRHRLPESAETAVGMLTVLLKILAEAATH
jgi:uncharacterized protein (DUF302 family)